MDQSTLQIGIASIINYVALTILLYGVNIGKHMVIISFLTISITVFVGSAAKEFQYDVSPFIAWIVLGFCGCVLAGGVIYRALHVYEYFKERKKCK
ncbi:hypothetical protein IHW74_004297 [Salmonella enterica]|nr:hypothetical protein [Salmonella enterica]